MQDSGRDYASCPKDEVSEVFNTARGIAEGSVRRLEIIIKEGNYVPHQTEAQLLAELDSPTIVTARF
jgi:DNA-binding LacI/PurR family transcriptional regulator